MGVLVALWILVPALSAQEDETTSTGPKVEYNRYRATITELEQPRSVEIDADGMIWISGWEDGHVHGFDRDGQPVGLLVSPAESALTWLGVGKPTVALSALPEILTITNGDWKVVSDGVGTGPGQLSRPRRLAVAGDRVAVADRGNRRVQVFDLSSGEVVAVLGPDLTDQESLLCPVDVAFDEAGRLFVLDQDRARIHRLSAAGYELEKSWGAPGAYPGLLSSPGGLACSEGRVFVADSWNHRIEVFDSDGKWQFEWGLHAMLPREGEGHLHYPNDITIAPDGSFAVVLEPFEQRAQIFDRKTDPAEIALREEQALFGTGGVPHFGRTAAAMPQTLAILEPETQSVLLYDTRLFDPIQISRLGGYGDAPGQFIRPTGLACDAARNRLIVADAGQGRLQVFRIDRDLSSELGFDLWLPSLEATLDLEALRRSLPESGAQWPVEPSALATDDDGRLYCTDIANGCVWILGDRLQLVDRWAGFEGPESIAIDSKRRRAYIVETGRSVLSVVDLEADAVFDWPTLEEEDGDLEHPTAVAVTPDGSVLISDSRRDQVLRFSPAGRLVAAWGGPGIEAGRFRNPRAIVSERPGRWTLLDWGNHRGVQLTEEGGFLRAFGPVAFVQPTWSNGRRPYAREPEPDATTLTTRDGRYRIAYRLSAEAVPLNDEFALEVWVFHSGAEGPPLGADRITLVVDGSMPEHQHGMNQVPELVARPDGSFLVEGMLFHMLGRWALTFEVREGARTSHARVEVVLQ